MVLVQDRSLHGVYSGYPDDHMKVSQDPMDPPFLWYQSMGHGSMHRWAKSGANCAVPGRENSDKVFVYRFFLFFFFFLPPPTLISLFCMVFVQDRSLHGVYSGYPDVHMKLSQDPMDPPFLWYQSMGHGSMHRWAKSGADCAVPGRENSDKVFVYRFFL